MADLNFETEKKVEKLVEEKKFKEAFDLLCAKHSIKTDEDIREVLLEMKLSEPASCFVLAYALYHERNFIAKLMTPNELLLGVKMFASEQFHFLTAIYCGYLSTITKDLAIPMLLIDLVLNKKLENHRPDKNTATAAQSACMLLRKLFEDRFPETKGFRSATANRWLYAANDYVHDNSNIFSNDERKSLTRLIARIHLALSKITISNNHATIYQPTLQNMNEEKNLRTSLTFSG